MIWQILLRVYNVASVWRQFAARTRSLNWRSGRCYIALIADSDYIAVIYLVNLTSLCLCVGLLSSYMVATGIHILVSEDEAHLPLIPNSGRLSGTLQKSGIDAIWPHFDVLDGVCWLSGNARLMIWIDWPASYRSSWDYQIQPS